MLSDGENKRIAFYTLGCKVNQYETQMLQERFAGLGFDVVGPEDRADIYVVNSCTVTGMADRKSRNFARRSKRMNPEAITVLAGCYAEVAKDSLAEISEIDLVVGSADKDRLPEILSEAIAGRTKGDGSFVLLRGKTKGKTKGDGSVLSAGGERGGDVPSGGGVSGLADRTRAYIKIEDGCDRYCAYCIVPFARGAVRSRPLCEIEKEARTLIANGYKELVLTGVNAALYESEGGIIDAVDAVSKIDGDFRIRLSSLEPTVIDADYARELVKRERLCPHLHLSLQSGSDRVLAAMGRRYTMEDYLRIVDVLKAHDALYSVTTDLIVGFPGESDDDFRETMNAVDEAGFSRIHVFKYSKRDGTKAASMKGQIAEEVKAERSRKLIEAGKRSASEFIIKNAGSTRQTLLLEQATENKTDVKGITDNDITVIIKSKETPTTGLQKVRLSEKAKKEPVAGTLEQ